MNFFRGVMGGQSAGAQPSGVETIQKLCDRVASSTLLEDRRDAVRALKSLSKKYRMEVGTQAMEHLIRILQSDRSDSEILGYALDTLYNIICSEEEEEQDESEDDGQRRQEDDVGVQFADKFIQDQENVTLLLSLLEEFDFHVRWPGVKLLTALLKCQCAQVQGIVLISPMGVSRLMDLLADSREVIRNDGLLLLQQLTKGNAAIQKIVAFENAFERLLDIITEEGTSDGGIVVEDCLLLLLNLLKNNSSNQNFFKEGSFIQRMKQWFQLGEESGGGWSAQKVTNLHLMLQLVRVMVSPVNSPGATASCQKSMFQCGLLQQLCTILMATGVPADILTETINTVSEVIRGSQVNQDYFASVNAPSNPPRPAIVVLLMSMVNERQPFVLRCAVLYCFQCFLYKNHKGQAEIVSTLLPSTIDAQSISAGQLLCGGLFSADSLSNWCASVALAHALHDNSNQKEQLLRVQLATSLGKPPISLLQQCTNILSQGDKISRKAESEQVKIKGSKVQTRVGLLMLLCTWISNCPIAVTHFLHNQENVPFLTAQISENLGEDERLVQGLCALLLGICIYYNDNSLENYTKEKLKQLIEKRIGKENFVEKLGFITKHELYSRAAQKPQPTFSTPEHMLFDHEFTKLVKELEGVITKAVHKSSEEEKKEEEVKKTLEQHDSIVTQYKELIREQDAQITELKEQVSGLTCQKEQMESTITQQLSQIQQHKDQYNILKLKLGKDGAVSQADVQVNGVQVEELTALRVELEELRTQHTLLQTQLTEKDTLITSLKAEAAQSAEGAAPASENTELLKEVEALRAQVQSQQAEISQLQSERHELQRRTQTVSGSEAETAKLSELEQRLSAQTAETHRLQEEVRTHSDSRAQLEKELAAANSTVAILQTEKAKLQQEVSESKKEQDDLLMLLADQDQKILSLKKKLKDLGETIEDEDDLDARDQSDDDDDDEEEEEEEEDDE
ncbi:general vesicular transport factor p115 isoform X1 [Pangasianodon hypophthalmus]|uniref:general vesicular transport factor p115 isoform X1 n=1 Tax=Pangasianodon hypophthalmus TaxID=310915 RepID=UPI0023080579|nr:general vesicular transport factor p115 isoform X1 [Pangasianodon hypophthalmus]